MFDDQEHEQDKKIKLNESSVVNEDVTYTHLAHRYVDVTSTLYINSLNKQRHYIYI